jgi:hypothetical protein
VVGSRRYTALTTVGRNGLYPAFSIGSNRSVPRSTESSPLKLAGPNFASADVQHEVLCRTAQRLVRPVGPVNVGRVKGATTDVHAEVGVSTALGEILEDNLDGRVG